MVRSLFAVAALAASAAAQGYGNGTNSTFPYKNRNLPVEDRVKDLLGRMTIEDKMAQLMQGDIRNWMNDTTGAINETGLVDSMSMKAGSFYVGIPVSWDFLTKGIEVGQNYLTDNTTLGIPAFVQTEAIHGFLVSNATIFNSPIAFACAFNRNLTRRMAEIIGIEAAALGTNQMFAPVVDLARELRFGRVEETYGEDEYLAGEIGYNFVMGLQSQNVSAMVKHFAGFSAPEQGINTAPVHGGERELRTTWLPSFKRAIIDANAYSIMSAYHSYDGIPAVADHHTLTEILREEWGYKYFVMSDAGGTDRLFANFRTCAVQDAECVVDQCLPAGNDVEMGGGSFNYRVIPDMVASGALDVAVVDEAVSRLLRAKFELGLFENPLTMLEGEERNKTIHTQEFQDLARELDRESIVLLQNPSKTLPISKSSKVAVVGPFASGFMNYGDYVVYQSQYRGVEYLQGIQEAVDDASQVTYAKGCERWSNDESGFQEAIDAANGADVTVLIVGTWSRDQNELWQGLNATTGEHVDVADLNLVGAQRNLALRLSQLGKPLVIVFSSGKPITETWISNTTASLVQQFYPSEQGGHALADILFGDHSPSGKLSVSFPRDVGTLPIYYDYLNSARSVDAGSVNADGSLTFGHQYVLNSPLAWFPFGHGLSYTTFEYSNVTLSETSVAADGKVTATVTVRNTGDRDGMEVVQFYVKDLVSSVVVPNMKLKGFEKVLIPAGESRDVSVELDVYSVCGLWDRKMQYVVEKGDFQVLVGGSSGDLPAKGNFTVV
ncbi:glycosyl hydrolase family 3 N terminal domain-containing protein [Elsinoe australis]|uniref:beta-glucosidase n=1 Tax=Elsinoe australis TaxID=40998 RepID=A0A4U7B191_9PEZI|nr:glycosyl hydrolase family 3 N terminal domain-containing protein [Elsinoe australis]